MYTRRRRAEWKTRRRWTTTGKNIDRKERVLRVLRRWTAFVLLTFDFDPKKFSLTRANIDSFFKRKLIPKILRAMQDATFGAVGRFLIKPEIGDEGGLHFHVILEVRPDPSRPNHGRVPKVATRIADRMWDLGDIHESHGNCTGKSLGRVASYFCKDDPMVREAIEEWGQKYKCITPSRTRPKLGIPPCDPISEDRVRRGVRAA